MPMSPADEDDAEAADLERRHQQRVASGRPIRRRRWWLTPVLLVVGALFALVLVWYQVDEWQTASPSSGDEVFTAQVTGVGRGGPHPQRRNRNGEDGVVVGFTTDAGETGGAYVRRRWWWHPGVGDRIHVFVAGTDSYGETDWAVVESRSTPRLVLWSIGGGLVALVCLGGAVRSVRRRR